jgi:hypothetical protein
MDGVLTFTGAVSYRLEWSGNEGRGTLPLFLPQGLAEVTGPDPTVQDHSQVTWVGAGTEGSKTKYVFSVDAGEAGAFVAMINQLSNAARESTAERDRGLTATESKSEIRSLQVRVDFEYRKIAYWIGTWKVWNFLSFYH